MKRTAATRLLILLIIISAVLSLPSSLFAAIGAQPSGCHCQDAGPGLVSGHCCCPPGMPGRCGDSGQGGAFSCRCGSGSLASISSPASDRPIWQVTALVLALVTVSTPSIPPNIFHPPELIHFSTPV
jgi:hypothetical protein